MILTIKDIRNKDNLLSAFSFANPSVEQMVRKLKGKYPNVIELLVNFDGYAFSSNDFFEEPVEKSIPLIQINNVNELEYNLNPTQKFVYLPPYYRKEKERYELKNKSVLVSLTGGNDKEKDISIFYDHSFPAMLNQRVCAFSLKENVDEDVLYYFYGLTFSQIFKEQWMGNGGVQKNTGKKEKDNLYLPYINDEAAIRYVAVLVRALIHKSKLIAEKYQKASVLVEEEIRGNQKEERFHYTFPTVKELSDIERMDAKVYSDTAKELEHEILHYKNGYFTIPSEKIRGGNTPQKRSIAEDSSLKYFWVTPTIFSDIGMINQKQTINCQKNNIQKNCLLLVNRTSKGIDGKYVGMSYFYNKEELGEGQYNQGIYCIQDDKDDELLYLNALINSQIYRTYFGLHSLGSKMKEIKIKQISHIPFPVFEAKKREELLRLYHNEYITYDIAGCKLDTFEEYDRQFNQDAGIYELDSSIRVIRKKLHRAVDSIMKDIPAEILF